VRHTTCLLLALMTGCTWVGSSDYDERLQELDDDGDGYTRDGGGDPEQADCDDSNPNVNPGATETWYDGVDQDCLGDDDFDKDGDGYRHESSGDESVDCNDSDPDIFPGAPDEWYDNVDSNCDGEDDFDQDGDGVQAVPPDGPGTDCNDLDASIYPGASDTWYDGVDQDCGGDNDFDQDLDGYVASEHVGAATSWDTAGELPCTTCPVGKDFDCEDTDSSIYKGAADAWYDGVDSNCDEANDYDQDVDGYEAVAPDGAGDDCLDTNDQVYPGGLEDPTDELDRDCDGSATSVASVDQGLTLVDPSDLVASEDSTRTYFSVAAREVNNGSVTYFDTALAFWYTFTDPTTGIQGYDAWLSSLTTDPTGLDLTTGQAFTIQGGQVFGAAGVRLTGRTLSLARYDISSGVRDSVSSNQSAATVDFDSITMAQDNSSVWHAFGCDSESGSIQYIQTDEAGLDAGISTGSSYDTTYRAEACAVHFFSTGVGTLGFTDASTGELVTLEFDYTASTPTFTEASRDATVSPLDLDYPDFVTTFTELIVDDINGVILVTQGGTTQEISTGATVPVNAAMSVNSTDGTLYVAWADDAGGAGFAYGDMSSGFTAAQLSVDHTVLQAVPKVTSTGNHLMIGLLGSTELSMATMTAP
jgi:hypothetical protein